MANRRQCKPNKESSIRLLSCRLVSNIAYRVVVCLELLLCFPLSSIFCPCATKKDCKIRPPRNQCQTACAVLVETNKGMNKGDSEEVVGDNKIKAKAASATSSNIIRDERKFVMRSESTIVQYQMKGRRRRDDCDDDYGDDDRQYRSRGGKQYYDDQDYSDSGYPEPQEHNRKNKKQRPNPAYDPTCVDNTRLAFGYDNIPPHNRDKYDADCPKPRNYEQNYQDDMGYRSQNYDDGEGYDEGAPDPCEKPYDRYSPENVKIKYGPDRMKYVDKNKNMLLDSDPNQGYDPNQCYVLKPNKTPMVRCKLSLSRTQRLSRSQRWLPGLGKLNLQQIGFPDNWFGNPRIKDAYDSAKVKTKNPFKKMK